MTAGLASAAVPAGVLDVLGQVLLHVGQVLLHGPVHAAESSNVVALAYVVLGTVLVGLVGSLLFWYYERRAEAS